jgi:hypothetical protein
MVHLLLLLKYSALIHIIGQKAGIDLSQNEYKVCRSYKPTGNLKLVTGVARGE